MLPDWFRYRTHEHVLGTTQSGKSKYLADCMLRLTLEHRGFCLLDWHGTLYRDVLSHLAYLRPSQRVHLLDLSASDFINPINPFAVPDGWDATAHASSTAEMIVKCWGASLDEMPRFERIVKGLLTFSAVSG